MPDLDVVAVCVAQVPYSQPARALHMLQAFLNDESL